MNLITIMCMTTFSTDHLHTCILLEDSLVIALYRHLEIHLEEKPKIYKTVDQNSVHPKQWEHFCKMMSSE